MRLAWPERIVLIVFAALVMLAVEMGLLMLCKGAPDLLVAFVGLASVFLDLWLVLRLVDWLFAGPARRKKDRIVKFSP